MKAVLVTRLVSADEARGLLAAYCVPGASQPLTLDNESDAAMFRAAPALASTVIALSESAIAEQAIADDACRARDAAQRNERDHLSALRVAQTERDRLRIERDCFRDILACEMGKAAPEGWMWSSLMDQWMKSGHANMHVQRFTGGYRYCIAGKHRKWSEDQYAYTLEAIEAADRAAGDVPQR